MSRKELKVYLEMKYPGDVAEKVLDFFECPKMLNYRLFIKMIEQVNNWDENDILFLCFHAYNFKNNGIIDQDDTLKIFNMAKKSEEIILDF